MNLKLRDMSRQICINRVLSFLREDHALRQHPTLTSNEEILFAICFNEIIILQIKVMKTIRDSIFSRFFRN